MSQEKGLASGSLGTLESAVMGVAGSAPAFSVAVTTAVIVASVGVLSVGSVFYCGLIMFGILFAFINLNKMAPHAGATYAWVGAVFGPGWGFFAGWGLLVASVIFMVSATIPAATSTLKILSIFGWVGSATIENTTWVTCVSSLWLTLVTIVVSKGIKHASYAQLILTVIESSIVLALIIGAFVEYGSKPAHLPSFAWVSPLSFSAETFATGALTAIFFYWGWDVTMNLGEETKGGIPPTSSKGAFWSMVNLMLFYIIIVIVVLIVLTDEEIAQANTNVLYAIADKLFPKPWSYLAVLSTVLSTIGTIETQILQFSRTLFAMSRDKVLHPRFSKIHPEWQTPWVATLSIWLLGVFLLFASSYLPSVKDILDKSISAIGFQICFYMSLAGVACAWNYRAMAKGPLIAALTHIWWPLFSAAFMVFIAILSALSFDPLTNIIGIGGLLLGFVPLRLNKRTAHTPQS
jgi:amino acid transporter